MVHFIKAILSFLLISAIGIVLLQCCTTQKKAYKESTGLNQYYLDSTVFKMNRAEIVSDELKQAIATLIQEFEMFEPTFDLPDYPYFIGAAILEIEGDVFLKMRIKHSYILSFAFPGAEHTDPLHYSKFPVVPTKLDLTFVNGTPVVFGSSVSEWQTHNPNSQISLINISEEPLMFTAYAYKYSENDEWINWFLPWIAVYYKLTDDGMVFEKYIYDKTGTDGTIHN